MFSEDFDISEILDLLPQASEGKDNIERGAVGYEGYGFVFRDFNSIHEDNIPFVNSYCSKFSAAGSMRGIVKKFKKLSKYERKLDLIDIIVRQEEIDLLLAGSLKTLIPELQFGGDEALFHTWMFAKTPDGKTFPGTFYYGASGPSVGGWMKYISSSKCPFNFSPFDFKKEELNLFLDALEFALKKVPVSDFEGVYGHDMGKTLMGIKDGQPFQSMVENYF